MASGSVPSGVRREETSRRARPSVGSVPPPRPGIVYLDGGWWAPDEAKLSVFDHGLLYGDGVFEGIRFYNGRVFKLDRHLERMYRSAAGIGLEPPVTLPRLREIILEACARSGLREGYLRPVFTRGKGDLGIDPRRSKEPSVLVICATMPPFVAGADRGIRLIVAGRRKTPAAALDPTVKSLNYLNNVLAKIEANARHADEALLLGTDGHVAEASAENIFVVRGGQLVTPPCSACLDGITRETVLELSKGRIPSEVREFGLDFLLEADEVFLTGTGGEILPVIEVEGHRIGPGVPGPVTQWVRETYFELVRSTGTPIPYSD